MGLGTGPCSQTRHEASTRQKITMVMQLRIISKKIAPVISRNIVRAVPHKINKSDNNVFEAMPSKAIRVGCKVSSLIGPMQPLSEGQKRRTRERFFGTVIKSADNQQWTVYWDRIDRCANHSYNSLKYEAEKGSGLDGVNIDTILKTKHLGDSKAIEPFLSWWQPPATPLPFLTTTTTRAPRAEATNTSTLNIDEVSISTNSMRHIQPAPNDLSSDQSGRDSISDLTPNETATTTSEPIPNEGTQNERNDTPDEEDGDLLLEGEACELLELEEVFDPNSIIRDFVEDERQGRHLQLQAKYEQEKSELIGMNITTSKGLTWKVRNDIEVDETVDDIEQIVGIKFFDFNDRPVKGPCRGQQRINFLQLLIHLWPGNWKSQLVKLNEYIDGDNKERTRMSRHGRVKKVKEVTEREFWIFWGVMLVARIEGKPGGQLWETKEPEGYGKKVDLGCFMKRHRFMDIKSYIPFLFADLSKKDCDPWWQFGSAVDEYNANRRKNIQASLTKVFDESMSAYRPRTTKFGNLPHLSMIARKPEPLGTEFKVTNSTKLGIGLYLEIQKGKELMANHEFVSDMKKTSACCCRMAKGTLSSTDCQLEKGQRNTYLGDSWFASVETVVELRIRFDSNFIGIIKTNHARYPKKWIEETMKEWPAGSHLVLEAEYKEVPIVAVGYKYNKRKVCCFVFSKGMGHTKPGRCYEAKWKDNNGNTLTRDIARPHVIAKYFRDSNIIDVFNQSRQFDLRLEKQWVTDDGFFRLVTTLFGIVVVDCWKGYNHHLPANHRHKGLELDTFIRILAKDLLENKLQSERLSEDVALTIMENGSNFDASGCVPPIVNTLTQSEQDALTTLSSLSQSRTSTAAPLIKTHPIEICQDEIQHEVKCPHTGKVRVGKRKRRGKCGICSSNTRYYCLTCMPSRNRRRFWCCPNETANSKRNCHEKHVKASRSMNSNTENEGITYHL